MMLLMTWILVSFSFPFIIPYSQTAPVTWLSSYFSNALRPSLFLDSCICCLFYGDCSFAIYLHGPLHHWFRCQLICHDAHLSIPWGSSLKQQSLSLSILLPSFNVHHRLSALSSPDIIQGFPGGSNGKEPACNSGDQGSIPGSGRHCVTLCLSVSPSRMQVTWQQGHF